MGHSFYELVEVYLICSYIFQNKPDTFYRDLTKDQLKYLRKNQVKVTDSHRNKMMEAEGANIEDNQDFEEVAHMFPSLHENEEG